MSKSYTDGAVEEVSDAQMRALYPHFLPRKTRVIAFKRGIFGGSLASAEKWAKQLSYIYETLHTRLYFAWRVSIDAEIPKLPGRK